MTEAIIKVIDDLRDNGVGDSRPLIEVVMASGRVIRGRYCDKYRPKTKDYRTDTIEIAVATARGERLWTIAVAEIAALKR
jgi:hypothetical protein